MKNAVLICLAFAGCVASKPEPKQPVPTVVHRVDTVVRVDTIYRAIPVYCAADSIRLRYDSLRIVADTVAARLLHSRLIISNVRYYLNIALRSPSQDKFLKGWIKRALE